MADGRKPCFFSNLRGSSLINPSGILFREFQNPIPDAFAGNVQSTFCEKVFHIAKAQCETEVQPNRMLDNLRWKSVSFTANLCHSNKLTPMVKSNQQVNFSMPGIQHCEQIIWGRSGQRPDSRKAPRTSQSHVDPLPTHCFATGFEMSRRSMARAAI